MTNDQTALILRWRINYSKYGTEVPNAWLYNNKRTVHDQGQSAVVYSGTKVVLTWILLCDFLYCVASNKAVSETLHRLLTYACMI